MNLPSTQSLELSTSLLKQSSDSATKSECFFAESIELVHRKVHLLGVVPDSHIKSYRRIGLGVFLDLSLIHAFDPERQRSTLALSK
jgi:hypothetical protein